jgi:outer membrane lipoprotein-sorting protein
MKYLSMFAFVSLVCVSGCASQSNLRAELDRTYAKVQEVEAENAHLRNELKENQSLACHLLVKAEDTVVSAYNAAKPVVIQESKNAATWVSAEIAKQTK